MKLTLGRGCKRQSISMEESIKKFMEHCFENPKKPNTKRISMGPTFGPNFFNLQSGIRPTALFGSRFGLMDVVTIYHWHNH